MIWGPASAEGVGEDLCRLAMELRHGRRRQSLTTGVLTHIPVDLMEEEKPVQRAKGQKALATPLTLFSAGGALFLVGTRGILPQKKNKNWGNMLSELAGSQEPP